MALKKHTRDAAWLLLRGVNTHRERDHCFSLIQVTNLVSKNFDLTGVGFTMCFTIYDHKCLTELKRKCNEVID